MDGVIATGGVFSYSELVEACRQGASILFQSLRVTRAAEPIDLHVEACDLARCIAGAALDDCAMLGGGEIQTCVSDRVEVQQ